ncbi:MAG: MoxR family ATPase [Psychroflexus sp.]|nr:MoxR family ATPase [Psychroflexus sp.]
MEDQNKHTPEENQNHDDNDKSQSHQSEGETFENRLPLDDVKEKVDAIKLEIKKVIFGQDDFIDMLIASLFARGHILVEGVPGVAKTITAKLFAKSIKTEFSRIQFTPDLMPSDVLGTSVFNEANRDFEFKKGPIFSNIVLIDEINRSPAKTQSSLFEVMEERQVSIDGRVFNFDDPFMVLATQNPIEQEGTYELPEAQVDRFLCKIIVKYPDLEDEITMLNNKHNENETLALDQINPVLTPEELSKIQSKINKIQVEEKVIKYIAHIIHETRNHQYLLLGGSPRASIAILNLAKSFAAMNGRDFVTPEDVKKSLHPVLNHRLILAPEREMEGITIDQVIELIQKSVEIPR